MAAVSFLHSRPRYRSHRIDLLARLCLGFLKISYAALQIDPFVLPNVNNLAKSRWNPGIHHIFWHYFIATTVTVIAAIKCENWTIVVVTVNYLGSVMQCRMWPNFRAPSVRFDQSSHLCSLYRFFWLQSCRENLRFWLSHNVKCWSLVQEQVRFILF